MDELGEMPAPRTTSRIRGPRGVYQRGRNYYNSGMNTTVSEKGQITIPKALRERLGIRRGTVLEVDAVDGALVARKREPEDVLVKWRGRGRLPVGTDVDEYLRAIRG